jgi:alpha-methylacyl-CoA racemase
MTLSEGPLAGLRVLQVGGVGPAPFGTMLLGDLGAEVLSVRRPGSAQSSGDGLFDRNSYCVSMDLKCPQTREKILALVESLDVLVEGFRPGVMERLGLGPEACRQRNPRLIFVRMTGYGQDGPLAASPGHDINYVAASGVLSLLGPTDTAPFPPANLLADFAGGGLFMAYGVLAAVVERQRSGEGQVVDVAMVDGVSLIATYLRTVVNRGQWGPKRGANRLDGGAPFYNVFETSDGGHMALGATDAKFYAEVLEVIGVDVDPSDQNDRAAWPRTLEVMRAAFRSKSRAEWEEIFAGGKCCVSPVLTMLEAEQSEHHRYRGSFVKVEGVTAPAPAPRYDRTPPGPPEPAHTDPASVRGLLTRWDVERSVADRWVGDS